MHVLRERPAHPLETRPSTTHMLYRTDIQSGRRSSTPMGFNNSFKLSSVATTGNVTGQQLNVTGSSINPHGGPDIELTENFEDMVQSSTQWGSSTLPMRKNRLHNNYNQAPVR